MSTAVTQASLFDQALAWQKSGDVDKAMAAYRALIAADPRHRGAQNNLGQMLLGQAKYAEAEACFRAAIAVRDSDPGVHVNLGVALMRRGRFASAIAACEAALRVQPDFPWALNNLAGMLKDLGRFDEAMAIYDRARDAKGGPLAHSNYLLSLHYGHRMDREALYAEHRLWATSYGGTPDPAPLSNTREPDRRLRVAYLSPDLHFHPVAYFMGSILATHDRARFEIFCFASAKAGDGMTEILKRFVPNWREVGFLDDAALAAAIRAEQIDILVDLAGHTADNRVGTLALKPAPIQYTYLGYPDTTGLTTVDYRITDMWADPPGDSEAFASETLVRIPGGFLAYRPPSDAPAVVDPPAVSSGVVTFGSFNNLAKLSDASLRLWGEVLRAVPRSRFLLKSRVLRDPGTRELMVRRFGEQGIPADRLVILGGSKKITDVLAAYGQLDVALDPTPYNGTTTTCEALWMGVPVVTLAGDRHSARVGVSILNAAGLGGLAAPTPAAYVKIAAGLAANLPELTRLRQTMRARLSRSPLFDAVRLTRAIEQSYRTAWQRWCATP